MLTLVTVVHLVLATILIALVLMQDAKGGGAFGMGASGGSQSLFGSTGAANFLVKSTRWIAALFAGTCIFLSYMTVQKDESVIDGYVPPAVEAPVEQTEGLSAPADSGMAPDSESTENQ